MFVSVSSLCRFFNESPTIVSAFLLSRGDAVEKRRFPVEKWYFSEASSLKRESTIDDENAWLQNDKEIRTDDNHKSPSALHAES